MTDTIKGCYIAFTHDIRTDDAQAILDAFRQFKNVASVTHVLTSYDDWMNREKVKNDIRAKLLEFYESI